MADGLFEGTCAHGICRGELRVPGRPSVFLSLLRILKLLSRSLSLFFQDGTNTIQSDRYSNITTVAVQRQLQPQLTRRNVYQMNSQNIFCGHVMGGHATHYMTTNRLLNYLFGSQSFFFGLILAKIDDMNHINLGIVSGHTTHYTILDHSRTQSFRPVILGADGTSSYVS